MLRSRRENRNKAAAHESAGNSAAAFECYQRAVDISPAVAKRFIEVRFCHFPQFAGQKRWLHHLNLSALQALRAAEVDYIVAPFEADAQMAYLAINNKVQVVITEDSDLLPYGCPKVQHNCIASFCPV